MTAPKEIVNLPVRGLPARIECQADISEIYVTVEAATNAYVYERIPFNLYQQDHSGRGISPPGWGRVRFVHQDATALSRHDESRLGKALGDLGEEPDKWSKPGVAATILERLRELLHLENDENLEEAFKSAMGRGAITFKSET